MNYALTYPQLINQAIDAGCDEADLGELRSAYRFTERMVDGLYRAQGVPFSCHLVRTASIVLDAQQPVAVVQAAMLHAAYRLRAFRFSRRRGCRPSHRRAVRQAVGEEAEAILWAYENLPWYSDAALDEHLASVDSADERTRQVLLIRLADELDDSLDLALAFQGDQMVCARVEAYGSRCAALAQKLGQPQIAEAFRAVEAQYRARQIPASAHAAHRRGYELPRRHLWELTAPEAWVRHMGRWALQKVRQRRG